MAVLAHTLFLLVPIERQLTDHQNQPLTVSLIVEKKSQSKLTPQELEISPTKPKPIEKQLEQNQRSSVPKVEPEIVQSESTDVEEVLRVERFLDIQSFAEQETKSLLKSNPEATNQFEMSFNKVRGGQRRAASEQFQNQYGEVHVITQVGNKEVCYQHNRQFENDDYGFNIVMFYDCANNTRSNTHANNNMTLELP